MKTPLSVRNEKFGEDKAKLVAAVQKLATDELFLDRVSEVKGLAKVSNKKLLRLHDILSDVKTRFGNRAKLIDAILKLEKREKDAGYKSRLEGFPTPRLVDLHGAAERRAKKSAAKPATAAKPAKAAKKPARSKKAKAKAASGKKKG